MQSPPGEHDDATAAPQRRSWLAGITQFYHEAFRDWRKRLVGHGITVLIFLLIGLAIAGFGFRRQIEDYASRQVCTQDWTTLICRSLNIAPPQQAERPIPH
jgi:hypothetical protein